VTVISEFLEVAKGQVVWVDISGRDSLYQGKVESYDAGHVIISSDAGFDCIRIKQIRGISLPKQVEIMAK
jgi:hypothetical protein